jgi:choline dehydrogenase-like flavoprotein
MEQFDYVIVGGGTAACVLANRLTANGRYTVLMLEAGGEPKSMWIKIPAGFSKLLNDPIYNWRFETEPEENTRGRKIAIPRGKGLGGSSLINGMIYVHGQPEDYDHWAALGATGWSAQEVAPYFKKMESCIAAEPIDQFRGKSGPLRMERGAVKNPLFGAFFKAVQEAGHPLTSDVNGFKQEGFAAFDRNVKRGRRFSAARAYLHPVKHRKNLTVQCRALATKLITEGKTVVGVAHSF